MQAKDPQRKHKKHERKRQMETHKQQDKSREKTPQTQPKQQLLTAILGEPSPKNKAY